MKFCQNEIFKILSNAPLKCATYIRQHETIGDNSDMAILSLTNVKILRFYMNDFIDQEEH